VPREPQTRVPVPGFLAAIHRRLHRDEAEPAEPVVAELDEPRPDEVNVLLRPQLLSTIRHLPRRLTAAARAQRGRPCRRIRCRTAQPASPPTRRSPTPACPAAPSSPGRPGRSRRREARTERHPP